MKMLKLLVPASPTNSLCHSYGWIGTDGCPRIGYYNYPSYPKGWLIFTTAYAPMFWSRQNLDWLRQPAQAPGPWDVPPGPPEQFLGQPPTTPLDVSRARPIPEVCAYAASQYIPGAFLPAPERVSSRAAHIVSGERRAATIRLGARLLREVPLCPIAGLPVEISAHPQAQGAWQAVLKCPHCPPKKA